MALCGKHGLNKHFHHEVAAAAFFEAAAKLLRPAQFQTK
jgi:hypothetical protein